VCRDRQVTGSVVSVGKPKKFVLRREIGAELRPLRFKLEAIIEDIINKRDVLVPGVRVSNTLVEIILSHATIEVRRLNRSFARKSWSVLPFNLTEEKLRLGDVDVGWNIVEEQGERRKTRHGATDNFLSAFRKNGRRTVR
jgi:hypothetical protein